MDNYLESTLRCVVAAYAGVKLTDSDMKKLDVAANIAMCTTVCNIFVKGLVFTARYLPCEDVVKFSFTKHGKKTLKITSVVIKDNIVYIEDIH